MEVMKIVAGNCPAAKMRYHPVTLTRKEGRILKRKIIGFHQDEEHHWVADLECGHQQHVRHQPPLTRRPWVLTPEGRSSRLGVELDCKKCDEPEPGEPPAGRH